MRNRPRGPDTALWTCPVDGCEPRWEFTYGMFVYRGPMTLPIDFTSADVREAITRAAKLDVEQMQAKIREHLQTHDVLDFLTTIERLASDLAQQGSGIRPHLYSIPPDAPIDLSPSGRFYRGPIY